MFISTDPQNHQGDNTWFTPKSIIEPLGEFDLDVCTTIARPFDIAKKHIEVEHQDSLLVDWEGVVWCNPPYGKQIEPFIDKFIKHGNGVALVFARMGTQWMQGYLRISGEYRRIFFLRKRVKFIDRHGKQDTNAGTDSCLLCMGAGVDKVRRSNLQGVMI